MGGEFGHCRHFGGVGEGEGVYVEASSVALAQEIHGLSVTAYHGVAVFAAA